jgi:transketolase
LLLSRQNIADVPVSNGSRFHQAMKSDRGAYIVREPDADPDVVLVANGSEVSTLLEGAAKLEAEKGLKVRVVSAPSEGLFRNQSLSYQQSVLPTNTPTFGLTAGLPVTLEGLVGARGRVVGLDHFGYSAPYKVLDEKFGYTRDNVFVSVMDYLDWFHQQ